MSNTRLYPPYIEGKLPAQTDNQLAIPFEMNRSVASSEVKVIKAQIRTVATNQEVGIYTSEKVVNNIAYFDLQGKLQVGQYYKIQLAYVNQQGVIGYYSTVGIFKHTAQPTIKLEGLSDGAINPNMQIYQGFYSSSDLTEKEYSYSFSIYNDTELVYASGELLHNANAAMDEFMLPINLSLGIRYTIQYSVTTANGLTATSSYYIMESVLSEIPSPLNGVLRASMNEDEGYISIDLIANNDNTVLGGEFRLLRFVGSKYEVVDKFIIQSHISNSVSLPTHIYKDFTVAQGVEYRYALQQCGDKIFSEKLYSNYVTVNFEDMFLYDGERQLRLRFNPKVSSFKNTVLESKLDTLGSKYPFFFRNGNTYYKEFPISALISMLADDNEFFYSWKEPAERDGKGASLSGSPNAISSKTNLTAFNYKREREFKLEVMDWLNNGKPKLFRSPAEGNYIVRLMNVSMSPNDTLGRMLHTCNAQAYEIIENSYSNLMDYGLIAEISDIKEIIIGEIELAANEELAGDNFQTLHLVAIGNPGAKVELTFANGDIIKVVIGNSMIYDAPIQNDSPITKVKAIDLAGGGAIRIQYDQSSQLNYPLLLNGNKVTKIIEEEKAAQFIGPKDNLIADIIGGEYQNYNIMSLTLSVKNIADMTNFYSDVTMQKDSAGTVYTRDGMIVHGDAAGEVQIDFGNGVISTINLGQNTLYQDLEATYPNRWKMDSFGNITLSCDAFDDNHFKPTSIKLGAGVYANAYYSVAKYE